MHPVLAELTSTFFMYFGIVCSVLCVAGYFFVLKKLKVAGEEMVLPFKLLWLLFLFLGLFCAIYQPGPFILSSYGVFVLCGLVSAVGVACWLSYKRDFLPILKVIDISTLSILAGFLGARLFYYLFYTDLSDISILLDIRSGGYVFYGGAIVGGAVCVYLCKSFKISCLSFIDIGVCGLAMGHFFGRIGCFLSGCCFGVPSELGCCYPANSAAWQRGVFDNLISSTSLVSHQVLPIQLIESFGNLLIFAILSYLVLKKLRKGTVFCAYLFLYGLLRFVDEFYRGDKYSTGLTDAQVISLVLLVSSMVVYVMINNKNLDKNEST